MDGNDIIRILHDWNFWREDLRTGVPRPRYLDNLQSLMSTNQVITITGPRRAGKSFIMRQMEMRMIDEGLDRRNILHVNLEDPRFTETGVLLLEKIYAAYREYISPSGTPVLFLDEIQGIQGFEKWVRMMHELAKAKIVISGSNATLLSRELGTLLTGRHLDLQVFPLSLGEFLSFNNVVLDGQDSVAGKESELRGILRSYIEYGSFPEVVVSDRKKEILLGYFEDVIFRDILRRFNVRKEGELRAVARHCLSNISALLTFKMLGRSLNLSATTAASFAGYLEQAYLIFSLKRFSFKVKEQEQSPRKMYAADTGLANAVGFRFSENLGRLAENIVFVALKRTQALAPGMELYYWKDTHHREVDFVVKNGRAVERLIQVCWDIKDEKVRNRELRALSAAMNELDIPSATIVTESAEGEEALHDRRVRFVPLWKWLIAEERRI
ncbi:MAG: hypothetical protein A2Z34_10045 [Planctomycetes bacterium RBG_16_59_8]|nr:MAG: hypothetical protein A2Z34_10045 [Planctomycetes bacterium RBG_16_59_8]